jgi:hypothetical protein
MMRALLLISLLATSAFAESPSPSPREVPVSVQFVGAHLSDLVKFYQSLTKRKVWLDAQLRFDQKMSLVSDGIIPRAEAIRLIRGALQKEGVEIREVGDSEAYVSRIAP